MQALLQTAVAEQDKHMFLSYITSSRRLVWHFHGVIGEPGTYLPAPQFSVVASIPTFASLSKITVIAITISVPG